MDSNFENLGTPDISFGGVQIWIHGREFPLAEDYWDGNWLRVTIHCGGNGSSVWTSGPILHLGEIEGWLPTLRSMVKTLSGTAALECIEPYFGVLLVAKTLGHVEAKVSITPDHLTQRHEYIFVLDQTFLSPLVQACERVLSDFPIKLAHQTA